MIRRADFLGLCRGIDLPPGKPARKTGRVPQSLQMNDGRSGIPAGDRFALHPVGRDIFYDRLDPGN
jgi:hypothetical protein